MASMPRWCKRWFSEHPAVKFSTVVQNDFTLPLIEKRDPTYFAEFYPRKIDIDDPNAKSI